MVFCLRVVMVVGGGGWRWVVVVVVVSGRGWLQKWSPEGQICDRGCTNGAQRSKSVIGVAKIEPRGANL